MTELFTKVPQVDVVIADGESLSDAIELGIDGKRLCGVIVPSTITGTTMSFEVSTDGVTYGAFQRNGEEYTETITAGKPHGIDLGVFYGWPFVKLRMGTEASPSAQSGDQTIGAVVWG